MWCSPWSTMWWRQSGPIVHCTLHCSAPRPLHHLNHSKQNVKSKVTFGQRRHCDDQTVVCIWTRYTTDIIIYYYLLYAAERLANCAPSPSNINKRNLFKSSENHLLSKLTSKECQQIEIRFAHVTIVQQI